MRFQKLFIAILFTLGFWGAGHTVSASHLYGGEVKYQYLDAAGTTSGRPYRYKVTFIIYWNCGAGAAQANPSVNISFFSKSTTPGGPATAIPAIGSGFTFNRAFGPVINPPIPAGCTVTVNQCVQLIIYEKIVDLPPSIGGYITLYSVAARNNGIKNILDGQALTLFADMGPTFRFNNSPVFTDTAVAIVCSGDTATIINNATDPDGDKLIYSFVAPSAGSSYPPSPVNYRGGYSEVLPFGNGGYAFLNASSGLTKYYIPTSGEYVVSFEIKEYRNINGVEELVGRSIRDIQLFVSNQCGSNASPKLTIPASNYSIQAGGNLSFSVRGSDPDSLTQALTFSGELFGPDGIKIMDLTKITTNGTGIKTTINFNAPCIKPGIYTYNLRVKDVACPFPKTDPKIILINVLPFKGTKIQGDSVVCNASVTKYFVTRPAGSNISSVSWKISSGTATITPGVTQDTVYVTWTGSGNGVLTSKFLSTANCQDSTIRTVSINQGTAPTFTGLANNYCLGDPASNLTGSGTGGTFAGNGIASVGGVTTFNPNAAGPGTHQVTYTVLNNTCRTTTTQNVTVNALPTPNFGTLSTSYCVNATAVALNGANTTYLVDGTASATFNPAILGVGTHVVTATTTNATGCIGSGVRTVTVNPLPTPSLAFLNNRYCKNAGLIVLNSGSGLTYTLNGNPITGTTINPATLTPGTYTVGLTEINANNCSQTVTRSIIIDDVPVPAITGLAASYCQNASSVTLTANLSGSTFQIDGTGPQVTVLNPATLSVGNHTVVVTNTNANNCTGTSTQTVVIKAIPTANFGTLATAYCKNDPAVTLPTTGNVYTLDGTTTITSFNPTTLSVGAHTVSVVTTNSDGCSVTGSKTVTINALPTPTLTLNNNYCGNAAPVALPSGTGISTTVNGTATASFNPATLGPGTHTVVVTETNGTTGCVGTFSKSVVVYPVPATDAIAGAISVCPGISGIRYSIVNPRETTYNWTISAGLGTITSGQGTNSILVNWGSTAGAATISAQPQNPQGCLGIAATLPVNITQVLATPQPVGPTSICLNQANQVKYVMTNPTAGSTFTWSIPGATVVSNTRGDTVKVTFTTTGTHNIVVQESSTGSSASGPVFCFGNSAPFPVTILASPNASLPIAGPASVCENQGNVSYSLTGGPANSTYAWSVTFNSSTTPLTGTGSSVQFNAGAVGQYTIKVIETNAAGCVGLPISKVVTITPRPILSQIKGPAYVCPENLNNQLYYVASTPGQTFNWTVTGGTMVNPGSTNDSIYVNFNSSATKEIKVTPISATGCAGTPFTMTVILDLATLKLNVSSTTLADDKTVELSLQMPGNSANTKSIDVYRREAGGTFAKIGTVANTATTFPDNSVQTGSKVYEYYLQSSNECGTVLKSEVHNTILLDVVANEPLREVYLHWNAYKGWGKNNVKSYEIYGQADQGSFELLRTVSASDSVLTLTNISGRGFNQCFRIKAVSTDTRVSWSNISCVTFVNPLAFFNIITPNNDKYNDFFVIDNIKLYPGNELTIYNRWGSEVYRKKDYDNTWEGKNQSDGTYYYLLRLKDGRQFKGWVEIVR